MMLSGVMCAMCGVALVCDECEDMEIPMYCSDKCAKGAGVGLDEFGKARVCNH